MATLTTPADPQTELTAALINQLYQDANSIVGATFKVNLSPIDMGATGLFPYYWQDPSNLKFNSTTYDWIKQLLKKGSATTPVAFNGVFHDQYFAALSAISYSFSKADQVNLNNANANTTDQQGAVLRAWDAAFGSLPASTSTTQPIDDVLKVIRSEWATDSKTTLQQMQNSKNLRSLLGNMPAAGATVLPVLINYLNAMSSVLGLVDTLSYKSGYLQSIINVLTTPSASNGAVLLNNGLYAPAYPVSTQISDIINGLKGTNTIKLNMSMEKNDDSTVNVTVNSSTYTDIDLLWFFNLDVENDTNYFHQNVVDKSSTISIEMDFTGVTCVEYSPLEFDYATGLGWFSAGPILEAIKNGNSDVSGYKFNPASGIDFSQFGDFGFSNAVAIANYPTITITITSDNYQSIYSHLDTTTKFNVSSMCGGGTSNKVAYSKTDLHQSDDAKSITIVLGPPANLVAGTSLASTSFVMGIQTEYPAAN